MRANVAGDAEHGNARVPLATAAMTPVTGMCPLTEPIARAHGNAHARGPGYRRGCHGTTSMRDGVSLIVAFLVAIVVGGCAGRTPIRDLVLPPVSIIEGRITQVDAGGFTLMDKSGAIYVRATRPDNLPLHLSLHDSVRVYGNLQGGPAKVFDGYVIRTATGEQIIVNTPTPHIGCIIQTSFE